MRRHLTAIDRDLLAAEFVERDTRFTVHVDLDGGTERVFMADPGALETVLAPGRTVLLAAADDEDRKTAYDAIAVRAGDVWTPVVARLANDLFAAAVADGLLPSFSGYAVGRREPPLPDHGRADFRLDAPDGGEAVVEVKSCTHVESGVAKFPDRQTERGRRHLRSLIGLADDGVEAHVAFVVQRPDVRRFAPYRAVDPAFADLLADARDAGVGVHALATEFDPPEAVLVDPDLPVALDG